MSNDTTKFYVESGNWRGCISLPVKRSEVSNYDYIEAATRAMESVFDERKEIGKEFEIISLFDKSGKDYFDSEFTGQLSDVPECLFGLLTACFLEKDVNNQENWWYFLSSKIFANAGQHRNVSLATAVEKQYSKEVNEFKAREEELIGLDKRGEMDARIAEAKKKMKKKSPPKKDSGNESDNQL